MCSVEETCQALQESGEYLRGGDELKVVDGLAAALQQARDEWQAERADARDLILALTDKVKKAHETAPSVTPADTHAQTLDALDNEKYELAKACREMEDECGATEQAIAKTKAEREALQGKRSTVTDELEHVVPRIRHSIQLYEQISNIKWDTSAKASQVRGIYARSGKKTENIDFDTQKGYSRYFIVDYLWDII